MKQKTKKPLSILLAVCMLLSITAGMTISSYAASDEIFTYEIENGAAIITTCDDSVCGDIVIPSTLGGYPVTKLADFSFYCCNNITGVTIPEGVTYIGEGAFEYCSELSKITLPDSVREVKRFAFSDTAYYENPLNWENDALYIGKVLVEVRYTVSDFNIKKGTLVISESAFAECEDIESLVIPEGVITVDTAFYRCTNLKSISFPGSVELIAFAPFQSCYSLESITVADDNKNYCAEDGVLFNKDKTELMQYPVANSRVSYEIPSTVTVISPFAFSYSSKLEQIIIPDSVTQIGFHTFEFCTGLKSLTLPEGITVIDEYTLAYCEALETVTLPKSVEKIEHGAFNGCESLTDVYYNGSSQDWNSIEIETLYGSNSKLVNAAKHFKTTEPVIQFTDLSGYASYTKYIDYTSVNNSFIKGTNPPYYTEFSPTTAITRAMFVTILYRMAGAPYDEANPHTTTPFTDITNTGVYYYNAACWALDNGITTQTTFKPNDLVVREQTASFLFRYASNEGFVDDSYKAVDLTGFSDFKTVSSWAVPAMQWANQQGMITGTQQGTLNPKGSTLRIHATKILYGFGMACGIGNL